MNMQPLKTEADYEAALARVETLWNADLGTPEGDELDALVTVVEAYEAEHYPIGPPDPVEALKFALEHKVKPS